MPSRHGEAGVAKLEAILTALAEAYFFSVATMPPLRWAALSADLPFTTAARGPAAPPRVRLPILVTESHSSDMLRLCVRWLNEVGCVRDVLRKAELYVVVCSWRGCRFLCRLQERLLVDLSRRQNCGR